MPSLAPAQPVSPQKFLLDHDDQCGLVESFQFAPSYRTVHQSVSLQEERLGAIEFDSFIIWAQKGKVKSTHALAESSISWGIDK